MPQTATQTLNTVQPISPERTQSEREINRAVRLSTIEIVIGSIGHGFKIPLTGYFLSLNQLYFLANALNKDHLPRSSTFEISGITAALKSLSVAGQKIGPMFSIMTQGVLFYLGTFILGPGLFGQLLGAIIMTLWSFIQSLFTYFIVFGFDYLGMLNYLNEKLVFKNFALGHYILLTVALAVLIKVFLGIGLVLLSYFKKEELIFIKASVLEKYKSHMSTQASPDAPKIAAWKGAFKDMMKPFFILNVIIMIFFFYRLDQSADSMIWPVIRSLGIAYLLFYCIRNKKIQLYLKTHFSGFYTKAEKVLARMTGSN